MNKILLKDNKIKHLKTFSNFKQETTKEEDKAYLRNKYMKDRKSLKTNLCQNYQSMMIFIYYSHSFKILYLMMNSFSILLLKEPNLEAIRI